MLPSALLAYNDVPCILELRFETWEMLQDHYQKVQSNPAGTLSQAEPSQLLQVVLCLIRKWIVP